MTRISYKRRRFPPTVIQHVVWPYFRFMPSFRDVEDMLAQRDIDVSYETVRAWTVKFGPKIAAYLRRRKLPPLRRRRCCSIAATVVEESERRAAADRQRWSSLLRRRALETRSRRPPSSQSIARQQPRREFAYLHPKARAKDAGPQESEIGSASPRNPCSDPQRVQHSASPAEPPRDAHPARTLGVWARAVA